MSASGYERTDGFCDNGGDPRNSSAAPHLHFTSNMMRHCTWAATATRQVAKLEGSIVISMVMNTSHDTLSMQAIHNNLKTLH